MDLKLPRAEPGDEITSDHFTALYAALMRLRINAQGDSGVLVKESPSGYLLSVYGGDQGIWIKVTSRVDSRFAWTEQVPIADGDWDDGNASGTTDADGNPAYEVNGTTGISLPMIVRAWRGATVLFQVSTC